jgi:hypothetical protein
LDAIEQVAAFLGGGYSGAALCKSMTEKGQ